MFNTKPPVPEVNFSEKLDDEPITNMDELIEKQRKEREEELKIHFPIHEESEIEIEILPQPSNNITFETIGTL